MEDKKRIFCGKCGEELEEDDKFCPNCGKSKGFGKNKLVIGVITLIAIILVGGYFGYGAYRTSAFDSNLSAAAVEWGIMRYSFENGLEQLLTGSRGVGAPMAKGSFIVAETYNFRAKTCLEKCKDFAQTPEEKRLIELLIERAELYEKLIRVYIKLSDLKIDIDLDFMGANAGRNLNSFETLVTEGTEIENKIEKNEEEVNTLLNDFPDLKKRLDT